MEDTKINVEKIKNDTTSYLLSSIERTRAHATKLYRRTDDFDGFHDVNDFLDEMEEHLNKLGRTMVD